MTDLADMGLTSPPAATSEPHPQTQAEHEALARQYRERCEVLPWNDLAEQVGREVKTLFRD